MKSDGQWIGVSGIIPRNTPQFFPHQTWCPVKIKVWKTWSAISGCLNSAVTEDSMDWWSGMLFQTNLWTQLGSQKQVIFFRYLQIADLGPALHCHTPPPVVLARPDCRALQNATRRGSPSCYDDMVSWPTKSVKGLQQSQLLHSQR